jgi:adenylyltransferase/sulfurtransferase
MLSSEELKRYNRHLILKEFGKEAQEKLKSSKVLVIGAGGLGCPVLQYLTAAGVGTIGIVDFDKVDESNLQRQVLYSTEDIGKPKAQVAAEKLSEQNPYIEFKVHQLKLSKDKALSVFSNYDLIVDGSDNFPTRYLVNDACVILNKPLVFGSIFKFEGQVTVFNYTNKNGKRGPTYRCLFPEPPAPGEVPNCSEIGVIGVLPGMIGTIQANEVIKVITGIGKVLSGRLFLLDALSMNTSILKFSSVEENFKITSLTDYEEFCGLIPKKKSITVQELKNKLDQGDEIVLIDVREKFEYDICKLGGTLIPLNTIPDQIHKIPKDKSVVVYCHHGMRSASAIKFLEQHGFNNLLNLEGGIHAWAIEIDDQMERY